MSRISALWDREAAGNEETPSKCTSSVVLCRARVSSGERYGPVKYRCRGLKMRVGVVQHEEKKVLERHYCRFSIY